MRRALAIAAVAAIATTTAPQVASAGGQDQLVGQGGITNLYAASVKAHSGPNGENPRGTFTVEVTGEPAIGTMNVSCMIVSGDTAIVGGLGINGRGNLLSVQDVPGAPDRMTVYSAGDSAPTQQVCAEILASFGNPLNGLSYGNFKVKNA